MCALRLLHAHIMSRRTKTKKKKKHFAMWEVYIGYVHKVRGHVLVVWAFGFFFLLIICIIPFDSLLFTLHSSVLLHSQILSSFSSSWFIFFYFFHLAFVLIDMVSFFGHPNQYRIKKIQNEKRKKKQNIHNNTTIDTQANKMKSKEPMPFDRTQTHVTISNGTVNNSMDTN